MSAVARGRIATLQASARTAGDDTPQAPGPTPHKAPQAPLRCPGGEDTPPEASEAPGRAPAREADK